MRTIKTHKELAAATKQTFCYLCGKTLEGASFNRDHVPPQCLFHSDHRDPCLILRTHLSCNSGESEYDERIGDFLSPLSGRPLDPKRTKLRPHYSMSDRVLGISNVPLIDIVRRWVRGFHTALYGRFLPPDVPINMCMPFPHSSNPGVFIPEPISPNHSPIARGIAANRDAKRLDSLTANEGKTIYECFWMTSPGLPAKCVFALRIYDWENLAPPQFERRGCVGAFLEHFLFNRSAVRRLYGLRQ